MQNRLMVRLIDVALIILLGFIAISRLKTEYVALPSPGAAQPHKKAFHEASLHIFRNTFRLEDRGQRWKCNNIKELENILLSRKNRYSKRRITFVVNIEPHKSSIMQRLVNVLDVCHRNKIEKSLNYENYN